MQELRLQPSLMQTLDVILSPRLLQTLKILNLPYPELIEQIKKEAEENVMLEVERQDQYAEFIRYLISDKKIRKETDFSDFPGLENIGDVEKKLEASLLEQLEFEGLEHPLHGIAKTIIENIDDFGYVVNYPRLREKIMEKFSVSRPTVDKALKIIQRFEPDGVGARNLAECLLIQLREYSLENSALEEVIAKAIENHLDDLGEKNYARIAAALGIPENGVAEIENFIKNNLNPRPASGFGEAAIHVIPSFAVEETEKGFQPVNLETRYGPSINLSARYLKMLDNPKTDDKTREFLKEKLKAAKNLMEDFSKRSETLEKIMRKIIGSQEGFLRRGADWTVPLSQKSLADEFGLHPSTISRAVAGKYIQTPQGLLPLKILCPRGPKGLTAARTKAMLINVIENEDKNNPLSDSQLTKTMQKMGAKIDRRTVAYYRKMLNVPTADARLKK